MGTYLAIDIGGTKLAVGVVDDDGRALVRTEPGQEILQKPLTGDVLCGRVEAACKLAA